MSNSTIRVRFGDGMTASDHLSAEVDGRDGGPNSGKTSFIPGDTAWFLVFRSVGLSVTTEASAGSVQSGGEVTVTREEDVSFEGTAAANLSVPAQAITGVTWLGRSLGDLTLADDGMGLAAADSGVAIARVSYTARALSFGLASPLTVAGQSDFDVLVLITGARPEAVAEEAA